MERILGKPRMEKQLFLTILASRSYFQRQSVFHYQFTSYFISTYVSYKNMFIPQNAVNNLVLLLTSWALKRPFTQKLTTLKNRFSSGRPGVLSILYSILIQVHGRFRHNSGIK